MTKVKSDNVKKADDTQTKPRKFHHSVNRTPLHLCIFIQKGKKGNFYHTPKSYKGGAQKIALQIFRQRARQLGLEIKFFRENKQIGLSAEHFQIWYTAMQTISTVVKVKAINSPDKEQQTQRKLLPKIESPDPNQLLHPKTIDAQQPFDDNAVIPVSDISFAANTTNPDPMDDMETDNTEQVTYQKSPFLRDTYPTSPTVMVSPFAFFSAEAQRNLGVIDNLDSSQVLVTDEKSKHIP